MEDNRLELSRELEEVRQQFAVMKERFDRQEIVNDGLLRNMQKRRINLYDWLNLYGPMIVIVAILPLMYLCCRDYGLPVWVAVMVYVVAATEIIWQYLERTPVPSPCAPQGIPQAPRTAPDYSNLSSCEPPKIKVLV